MSKYFQQYAQYRTDESKTLTQSVHIPTRFVGCTYDKRNEISFTSKSGNISWTDAQMQVSSNAMCPLNLVIMMCDTNFAGLVHLSKWYKLTGVTWSPTIFAINIWNYRRVILLAGNRHPYSNALVLEAFREIYAVI